MLDLLVRWWRGNLTEILGIPIFIFGRLGKLLQLVSGFAILVDVVGKERIENMTAPLLRTLNRIIQARPVYEAARGLWETNRYFALYYFSWPGSKREDKYLSSWKKSWYFVPGYVVGVILGVTLAIIWIVSFVDLSRGIPLLWEIPAIFGGSILISCLLVFFVGLILLAVFIYVIVYPIERFVDAALRLVGAILSSRSLANTVLVLSFIVFVVGSILEMLAS